MISTLMLDGPLDGATKIRNHLKSSCLKTFHFLKPLKTSAHPKCPQPKAIQSWHLDVETVVYTRRVPDFRLVRVLGVKVRPKKGWLVNSRDAIHRPEVFDIV